MAEQRFFLGINGQQSGPHSEAEVKSKIRAGQVRPDALVWFEGLSQWQRVDSLAYFQADFGKPSAPAVALAAPKETPSKKASKAAPPPLRPVFSTEQAVVYRRRGPRPEVAIGAALLLVLGGAAVWYVSTLGDGIDDAAPVAVTLSPAALRAKRLEKAESDMLLNPGTIPGDFAALLQEKSDDDVARKAFTVLENAYKKRGKLPELADLYLKAKRPIDAVNPLLELKKYTEAQAAAYQAYQQIEQPALRRAMLTRSIDLLTGPLQNAPEALAQIRLLEKEFPAEKHAFGYYLLSEDKKMADLFERTSFFFVESLLHHIKSEFPQIKLESRPLVKITKEKGGLYRITGNYQGDVFLSHDRLKGIRFEYWLVGSEWNLVATNVTRERQEWSAANRARHLRTSRDAKAMLAYLEGVMRAQFPLLGLHEKVSRDALSSAARDTASDHGN